MLMQPHRDGVVTRVQKGSSIAVAWQAG